MKNKFILSIVAAVGLIAFFSAHKGQGSTEYEFDPGTRWEKKTEFAQIVDEQWLLKGDSHVAIGIMRHGNADVGHLFSQKELKNNIAEFTTGRRAIMQFQGITDWTIKKYSLNEKNENMKDLTLEGTYTSEGSVVRFKEKHFFVGKHYYALTLTYPDGSAFSKSDETNILEQFKLQARAGASL